VEADDYQPLSGVRECRAKLSEWMTLTNEQVLAVRYQLEKEFVERIRRRT
jgi:hypothetical protein